jgi:hypothetical protein
MNNAGPPKILNEKVLAVKGKYICFGRIVIYHNKIRRLEVLFKEDPLKQYETDIGFTLEELQTIYQKLVEYGKEQQEF